MGREHGVLGSFLGVYSELQELPDVDTDTSSCKGIVSRVYMPGLSTGCGLFGTESVVTDDPCGTWVCIEALTATQDEFCF